MAIQWSKMHLFNRIQPRRAILSSLNPLFSPTSPSWRALHLAPPFLLEDYVPRYMALSSVEASKKRSAAYAHLRNCNLCPRLCGVNRYETTGMCLIGDKAKVNVIAPHFGEGIMLRESTQMAAPCRLSAEHRYRALHSGPQRQWFCLFQVSDRWSVCGFMAMKDCHLPNAFFSPFTNLKHALKFLDLPSSMCNLRCVFCQNHDIAHSRNGMDLTPEELGDWFIKLQEVGAVHNINLITPEQLSLPTIFPWGVADF